MSRVRLYVIYHMICEVERKVERLQCNLSTTGLRKATELPATTDRIGTEKNSLITIIEKLYKRHSLLRPTFKNTAPNNHFAIIFCLSKSDQNHTPFKTIPLSNSSLRITQFRVANISQRSWWAIQAVNTEYF